MVEKKKILDGLNRYVEKLDELRKIGGAITELGIMKDEYGRKMFAEKLVSRVNEMRSDLYMLEHYMEQLNQLEEGTIDNDEPVTEDDLPFDGKDKKE
jgi:hypothetical protein